MRRPSDQSALEPSDRSPLEVVDGTGLAAVVFDFDGTLADTEWPIYERARAALAGLGADLTPELWGTHAVGVSSGESYWPSLGPLLGLDIDEATFDAAYEAVDDPPRSRDVALVTAGAAELVQALHDRGIPVAVASGSSRGWVEHHLGRFGLLDRFEVVVGRDHPSVRAGKPAPDLYLAAVAELGVDPAAVVAIEDTRRGTEAAIAAGLGAVVAVPNRLTVHHDLAVASLVADALTALDPDRLVALVARPPS